MKKLYFRFFLTVLVLLPLVLLSSCFGSDFADLKVSASQTQSSAKAIYNTLEYNVDSELLKDEVKGTPEFVVTPSTYILDIDRIKLFNPIDKEDVTKGAKESFELISVTCFDSGYIVPKRYNMLSSKGIATFSLPYIQPLQASCLCSLGLRVSFRCTRGRLQATPCSGCYTLHKAYDSALQRGQPV